MKQLVYSILLLISCLFGICSCSNKEEMPLEYEEFSTLDFGKGTYRPNPFPFLDNVPPFSWMGMPDSVKLKTTLQISFNEDAVRSKSTAKLAFIDNNGDLAEGLTYDGYNLPYIEIDASTFGYDNVALIPIEITVNPSLGNTVLKGEIAVFDADVDVVNQELLSTSPQPVASWHLTQNVGINWLRWLIFIIEIAIALALIYITGWLLLTIVSILKDSLYSSVNRSLKNQELNTEPKENNREFTPLEMLKKYSTKDIVDMIISLDKTDNNLTIKNLCVERRYDGTIYVSYVNTYPGRYTSMRIKGNHIYAPAGSLEGGSPQNQFLNYILPNKVYHVDDVAIYKTDQYGRTIYAETDRVKMCKIVRSKRNRDTQNQITEGLIGYDGGHLFDCASGGANEAINQVPMESYFNRNGEWKKMEEGEKKRLSHANSFIVTRNIRYKGSSKIPYEFESAYNFNGHLEKPIKLKNPTP